MMEYGLADSKDANDLTARLESLRESWENLCPGFHKWFVSKRKAVFQNSVIECARKNTNVHGLFYNNSIECQHYLEKKEQSFRKGTVEDVIKTFKSLVERQQDEEVRAIYRSGPYRLSDCYQKFEVDSVKWHSMDPEARMKHVERFRRYRPTLDDQFDKPKSSGRKPSDRKRTRKPDFESAFDRLDKKEKESRKSFTFQDLNALEKISYELFFRSMVPRLVNRCQGNCGDKLLPADKDYLVVKSRGRISFMNRQGEMDSKLCPFVYPFQG